VFKQKKKKSDANIMLCHYYGDYPYAISLNSLTNEDYNILLDKYGILGHEACSN
jgi:hypothetical protein